MYTKVLATLIYRRVYDNDLTKFFLKNHVSVLVPIYVYTSLCRVNCDDDFLIPSMLSADPRENRSRPKLRSYDLPKIVGNFPQSILRWRPEVRWLQCSRAALHLIRNKMYTQ